MNEIHGSLGEMTNWNNKGREVGGFFEEHSMGHS